MMTAIFLCACFVIQLVQIQTTELYGLADHYNNALMTPEEFTEYFKHSVEKSFDSISQQVLEQSPEFDNVFKDLRVQLSQIMNETIVPEEICADGTYCQDNKVVLLGGSMLCTICETVIKLVTSGDATSLEGIGSLVCKVVPIPFCSTIVNTVVGLLGGSIVFVVLFVLSSGTATSDVQCTSYTAKEVGLHLKVITKERLMLAIQNSHLQCNKLDVTFVRMLDQLLDRLTTPRMICTYYAECDSNIVKKLKDSVTCLPCVIFSHVTMLLKNPAVRLAMVKHHCQFQPTSYEKIMCQLGLQSYFNTHAMHGEDLLPTEFCYEMGFCHRKFRPKMILPKHYYKLLDDKNNKSGNVDIETDHTDDDHNNNDDEKINEKDEPTTVEKDDAVVHTDDKDGGSPDKSKPSIVPKRLTFNKFKRGLTEEVV